VTYLTKITVKRLASVLLGVSQLSGQNVYLPTLIADIAVLGCPDNQAVVSASRRLRGTGRIHHAPQEILVFDEAQSIGGGMSGSPIISDCAASIRDCCFGGSNPSKNSQL
jgi:hypothetical protein